jgi:hypothetical protein
MAASRPAARLRDALTRIFPGGEPHYVRRESSSQTPAIAKKQEESGEIWGGVNRNIWVTDRPSVNAYVGLLTERERGVEFTTPIPPDPLQPPGRARWTGPREGVRIEDDFAKLEATIVKNTQS